MKFHDERYSEGMKFHDERYSERMKFPVLETCRRTGNETTL
jgi:hypothetical protein